jgi:hypothetical protein
MRTYYAGRSDAISFVELKSGGAGTQSLCVAKGGPVKAPTLFVYTFHIDDIFSERKTDFTKVLTVTKETGKPLFTLAGPHKCFPVNVEVISVIQGILYKTRRSASKHFPPEKDNMGFGSTGTGVCVSS